MGILTISSKNKISKLEKKLGDMKKQEEESEKIKEAEVKVKEQIEKQKEVAETPTKKLGLTDKIDRLTEIIESSGTQKKGKAKGFRLPGKVRTSAKKFHLKNKIIVFYINQNKSFEAKTTEIYKGSVFINDNWHGVPVDSIMFWKNKIPCIILPSWDLIPLSPNKLYGDAVEANRMVDAQTTIIKAMKMAETASKGKISGKALLWIGLAAAAVLWVIFGGTG